MLKNKLTIHISWGHCDPAKIVFYPNYFIWFDQSVHQLFDKVGANMGDLMEKYGVVGLPIVDAHAEFIYPSKYGDVIEVNSWISELRAKTMIASHEIYNNGQLCVKGSEIRVWAKPHPSDQKRLQAQIIPDSIKACFNV